MITVPSNVIEVIKNGSTQKNMRIVFVDGSYPDINNDEIIQDTFSMTESISDGNEIKFGANNASMVKFSCVTLNDIKGKEIECYLEIDTTGLTYDGSGTYKSSAMGCQAFPIYYGRYKIVTCKRQADDIGIREIEAYSFGYEESQSHKLKINNVRGLSELEIKKLSIPVLSNVDYSFDTACYLYSNIKGLLPDSNFSETQLTSQQSYGREYIQYKKTKYKLGILCSFNSYTCAYINMNNLFYHSGTDNANYKKIYESIADRAATALKQDSSVVIDYDEAYEFFLEEIKKFVMPTATITYPLSSGTASVSVSEYSRYFYPFINVPTTSQSKVSFTLKRCVQLQDIYLYKDSEIVDVIFDYPLDFDGSFYQYKKKQSSVVSPTISVSRAAVDSTKKSFICNDLTYSLNEIAKAFCEMNVAILRKTRLHTANSIGAIREYELFKFSSYVSGKPLFTRSDYHTCWFDDESFKYGKVICKYTIDSTSKSVTFKISKNDGTYYEDYEDFLEYDLSDNLFISNGMCTASEILTCVDKIASALKKANFIATEMDCLGVPYIEVGDWIDIQLADGNTVHVVALSRTISGINDIMDNISSNYNG